MASWPCLRSFWSRHFHISKAGCEVLPCLKQQSAKRLVFNRANLEITDLLDITRHAGEGPITGIIYTIRARWPDVSSKETILARMNEWVGGLGQRSPEAEAIATGR